MCRYIVRLDDIHPNMNQERFDRFSELMDFYKIKPIIGVIPDNQDESLKVDVTDESFFPKLKKLQNKGYIIAIHGYQHIYVNDNSGLMRINNYSEFAGLGYDEQNFKISKGLKILHSYGLETNMFMAPAHSFDKTTIQVLKDNGIQYITDGFYLTPYFKNGIFWIPQQFWAFRNIRLSGVFTFCFHLDAFSDEKFKKFILSSEYFFKKNSEKFIDLSEVNISQYNDIKFKIINKFFSFTYNILYRLKHINI